jgi:hypothetical protein
LVNFGWIQDSSPTQEEWDRYISGWTNWAYSMIEGKNAFDDNGHGTHALENQPYKSKNQKIHKKMPIFLAGTWIDTAKTGRPKREIDIAEGTEVVCPVVNMISSKEEDGIDADKLLEDVELAIANHQKNMIKATATIDGQILFPEKRTSGPFELHMVKGTYNFKNGHKHVPGQPHDQPAAKKNPKDLVTDAVCSGYWIYVRFLKKGKYTLDFEGSIPGFSTGAIYNINVL